jgi:hypothetical protein
VSRYTQADYLRMVYAMVIAAAENDTASGYAIVQSLDPNELAMTLGMAIGTLVRWGAAGAGTEAELASYLRTTLQTPAPNGG